MKREYSAGGIVINSGKVLMIKNAAMRDPKKAYWGFPKGHIEKGESSKDAAVREVEEETKIRTEVISKLGESQYVFTRSGEHIVKHVDYFLMRYLRGDVLAQELEVLEVKWFSPEEAMELLSFKKDKDMLKLALSRKL